MRQAQFLETGGVKLLDQPPLDRLCRYAQQGADQQVLGLGLQKIEFTDS
jgi:hypothetical protein